jgi:cell division protein FtsZ
MVQKKHRLQIQAMARAEKLRGGKTPTIDSNEYKEKLDVPAYLRRNVQLNKVPHSSDKNVSKYNLNDDSEMLGNNRFLHDNVD